MSVTIRRAGAADAQEILEYLKIVGGETDNLTFGAGGIPVTEAQQAAYLASIAGSEKDLFLTAWLDGKLVGSASYATFSKRRMAHRGEFGISVRQSAWGLGIGTLLLERLLAFAKDTAKADIVSLEVRSDNVRAIRLYEKFGFEKIGCFRGYFKIRGQLIDVDIMEKLL